MKGALTRAKIEYEEWIYGEPPADVDFVRIVNDEVVRVETMKIDGEKILRTKREVILQPPAEQEGESRWERARASTFLGNASRACGGRAKILAKFRGRQMERLRCRHRLLRIFRSLVAGRGR